MTTTEQLRKTKHFESIILNEMPFSKGKRMERIAKTEFKFVYVVSFDGTPTYRAEVKRLSYHKCFSNCRAAARAVDILLIKNGEKPVNTLTPITTKNASQ